MSETKFVVVVPECSDDDVSEGLRALTRILHLKGLADGSPGGFLGGENGYGTNFENETFMIHRYCWCERDDCPWCAECSRHDAIPRDPHAEACYQTRLAALKKKHGEPDKFWPGHYHVSYDSKNAKKFDKEKRALCAELGCDYEFGNEVHCTCGSDDAWQGRYDACECDWHLGRNQYRFGPATPAPNFLHKPSGSRVRWYKYIGRGMEMDLKAPWRDIEIDCHASLGSRA